MATLVRNLTPALAPIPAVYGGGDMSPGQAIIIADTVANVQAAFGHPPSGYIDIEATQDGQSGAISPSSSGSGGALVYTPATGGNWSTPPATVGAALDLLGASGAGGAGANLGGDLSGNLPAAVVAKIGGTAVAGAAAVTNGGAGNSGKVLKLDAQGKAAGRVLETDGAKLDLLPSRVQTGTATLVGGTLTVSSLTIGAGSKIYLTRNTPGGSVGDLSAPSASRTTGSGTGSFIINSASGTDTSTVDWAIVG